MRDFRDAKIMARLARCVEGKVHRDQPQRLFAADRQGIFGYEKWNILSAKIEAAMPPRKAGADALSQWRKDTSPEKTLFCSFCCKSQHDVRALIAGPTVFICDECVGLCDDIIDEKDDQEILSLLKTHDENDNQSYPNAFEQLVQGFYTQRKKDQPIQNFPKIG